MAIMVCYTMSMAPTTIGPPKDPRLAALYRVDLSVGDLSNSLDVLCDCGLYIRSTNDSTNLLSLVEAVMAHRHNCRAVPK